MSSEQLREKIIQKAWEDAKFKKLLLADPKKALKETFGIDVPDTIELEAVEDTPNKYHLVIPPNPSEVQSDASVKYPMWE
ncbi:NHLP leader peptide family RiPP precursor [Paenibacillus harenae]|uniref:NHLP leader peptide family RiPP precursor n=1 Tax=Paenibacillus harenae TaxID=306543 RepID=UPI0003FD14A2|nr:NHLP leader peptide family RiPP precursor [Paenibacillus harenae]